MFLIALVRSGGRGGSKAGRFCLSQPRGVVRTTSSKLNSLPPAVVRVTSGELWGAFEVVIELTTVFRWRLTLARMGLATASRIAL